MAMLRLLILLPLLVQGLLVQGFTPSSRCSACRTRMPLFASSAVPSFHHQAIKVRDIELSIKFYSLLDFEVESKFLAASNVRAAWLKSCSGNVRLELIEVPNVGVDSGRRRRAPDLVLQAPQQLGLNHLALDVTASMKAKGFTMLQEWIDDLNLRSEDKFGKSLRIAVNPTEQMVGQGLYQLAFLYDADGAIVELLYLQREFEQKMMDGWYE